MCNPARLRGRDVAGSQSLTAPLDTLDLSPTQIDGQEVSLVIVCLFSGCIEGFFGLFVFCLFVEKKALKILKFLFDFFVFLFLIWGSLSSDRVCISLGLL